MADLSGVALVTGASTGIGRHLVEGLAARGASVAGLARNEERLTTAMSENRETSSRWRGILAAWKSPPNWIRKPATAP